MMNTRHGAPEITGLNPFFPELNETELREFRARLKGALSPESFRKLFVCTFDSEVSDSGDKDE
ncbi:hypothetical protein COO59_02635 [Mixta theicola]|uniref:Uncharacterized protein n=1 Tax=Mixta theicola TaxID=1458355 RepID=A0A2K1QCS9_9GAMM|nr:hypothetical protein COO59_02635 [Mixta theicola]GLR09084.1 hypothetical protein GCM10007905_18040 [Mixta theicola]